MWSADAGFTCKSQEFFFQFHIAESTAVLIAAGGQFVVIAGSRHLDGLEVGFGGSAADDEGQVVGGAASRAE